MSEPNEISETFNIEQIENPDWYKLVDSIRLSDEKGRFIWSETSREETE